MPSRPIPSYRSPIGNSRLLSWGRNLCFSNTFVNSLHLSQAREALGAGGVPVSYLALVVPLHIADFFVSKLLSLLHRRYVGICAFVRVCTHMNKSIKAEFAKHHVVPLNNWSIAWWSLWWLWSRLKVCWWRRGGITMGKGFLQLFLTESFSENV